MANVERKISLPEPDKTSKFDVDLVDCLLRYTAKIGDAINGGIKASDNWDAQIITVTLAAANVEQAVAHTLKRVPTGYIVLSRNIAAVIYDGTTAWTSTNIYIRSDTNATTIKVILI